MAENQPKIVVIDDSATSISLYRHSIKVLQVDLVAFQSPLQALDYLKAEAADLVFLDILMGEKDGLSVLKELRSFERHRDTVVVIVTSKDYDQDRTLAKTLGAHEYMVKPLRALEIRDLICKYTGLAPVPGDDAER